jgi:hypothetical protein
MEAKNPSTQICDFVRNLTDEELKFLLESPTEIPEIMGLSDHLPFCEECAKRASGFSLFNS